MADTPDFAVTGTDTGVPAPQSAAPPPTPPVDPNNPAGNNTGVSVPPTEPISTSQAPPPHPPQTTNPQVNAQVQPGTTQPAPAKTMPQLPPVPKGVSPDNPYAYHPSVQNASRIHTIAEALGGGPRYDVKINPNTGETERTRKPMSTGDILGAIALEAISGAAAGLSVKNGPGNLGRAAGAGFGQVEQQEQAVKQNQLNQATTDYARHAQILETNMRMWQNAQTYGKQDYEEHQQYVGQYADIAQRLKNEYPQIVKAEVPESKLSDYHVTKDGAIPYHVVPRPDPNQPDGQARGPNGQKLWDNTYLVVDPNFKAEGLLSPEDKALAAKYHLQGFVDGSGNPVKLPDNLSLSLGMVLNYKSQIASLQAMEGELGSYWETMGKAAGGGAKPDSRSIFTMYGSPEKLADFITQHEGGKPGDRNVRNNNPGNLVADVSWSGPKDEEKLPPGQAPFRKYDSPEAGRQALISQIKLEQSRNPNMTPEQFFAKYDPGDALTYASAARQAAGAGAAEVATDSTNQPAPPSKDAMVKAIADDHTIAPAMQKAQAFINMAGGDVRAGLEAYSKQDPTGAGKVYPLFGGAQTVQQYNERKQLNLDQEKSDIAAKRAEDVANVKQQQKDAADIDQQNRLRTILKGPSTYVPPPDAINMNPNDLRSYLESHHAGVGEDGLAPDELEYLQKVARYDEPLGTAPVRIWAKGSPKELEQQQVIQYITKFINPNYSAQASKTWNEWNDSGNSKGGQIIYNAGVAANHLDLLREAGTALHNNNTSYLNRIGNEFGLNIEGKPAPVQFQAIADAAAREVSKVAAGSATPYAPEIESSRETLNRDYSPQAINGVIDSYTKLMAGRVGEADDLVSNQTGRHIGIISPTATARFQKVGAATPWVVPSLPKGNGAPLTDPGVLKQYFLAAGGNTTDINKQKQAAQQAWQWAQHNGWRAGGQQAQPISAPAQQQPQQRQRVVNPNNNEEADNSPTQGVLNSMY